MDDVHCKGTEIRIEDCSHADWGEHNCGGRQQDVAVSCLNGYYHVYAKPMHVIMENSTPCKYKKVKDIEIPVRIYYYIAESSCCAKFYINRIIHFGLANRGSFSFLFLTNTCTHRQTDKQILSSRLQVTNMDRIE